MKKIAKFNKQRVENSKFVYCELQFNARRQERLLTTVARIQNIKGVIRTTMDGNGGVKVAGEFDPNILFAIVRDKAVIKFHKSSLCFSDLYPPEPPKKENKVENNNNNQVYNRPTFYEQNSCYGEACECYRGSYSNYLGNGYQNYYPQQRIFGNYLLQDQKQEVTKAEKTLHAASGGGLVKKSQKSYKDVGGCCLM